MNSLLTEIDKMLKAYLQIYFCSCADFRYRHLCQTIHEVDTTNWGHASIMIQCITRLVWAYSGIESEWCDVKVRPKPAGAVWYILQNRDDLHQKEYSKLMDWNNKLKLAYPVEVKEKKARKKAGAVNE